MHRGMGFNNPDLPWRELERRLSDRPRRPAPGPAARGRTGATARPGRRCGPPTWRRPTWSAARGRCPTPSSTATRRSASSTGRAHPRSWWRRRPAWASRPWPSPTTTASTAWCASPRRPGRWGCPRCSARSCRSGSPDRRTANPTPRAPTCWCWPGTPRATRRWRPRSAPPSSPEREKGKPVYDDIDLAAVHRDHWLVLTGCRKGAVPKALVEEGPAAAAARAAVAHRHLRPSQRGRGALRPRRPARLGPQRRAGHPGAWPRGWRWWPPPTPTTPRRPVGAWPPRWRRCGPGAASTRSTGGCRPAPAPTCARGRSRPVASPAGRARWRWPPSWAGRAPSTCSWWPRSCRRSRARTGSSEMALPPPPHRGGGRPPLRPPRRRADPRRLRADRPRADPHRAARLPRLLPRGLGHRRLLPTRGHPLPGPRERRQQRGAASRSASPTRMRWRWACSSSGSCRPSGTGRRTSTSTSSPGGGRRRSSTSTSSTAVATRPRWPT